MSEITINQAQVVVDEWIKKVGVRYFNELTNMTLLTEEVGELARIMARKYGEQSFKAGEENTDPSEEMADVLFVLICLANQTGVNLSDALQKSLDKKTKRDSERHKNNEKLK
jgi:NTP pyrophosphatase (non-canonical NTP hydrolase)